MKDYKKYFILNAPPEVVYSALTKAATIQLWSGEPATMDTIPGSEFFLWDESISGKNLQFIPGKKIVQQWYFGDQQLPSIVTIILHDNNGTTSAELRHTNIPDEDFNNIVEGWNVNYFGSLSDFYEE